MMLATTIPFKRRNTSRRNSLIAVSLITAPDHTSCTAVLAMTGKHAAPRSNHVPTLIAGDAEAQLKQAQDELQEVYQLPEGA